MTEKTLRIIFGFVTLGIALLASTYYPMQTTAVLLAAIANNSAEIARRMGV